MKTITLLLIGLLTLGTLAGGYYINKQIEYNKQININGLEIKSKQFSDLVDVVPEGNFVICNIEKDKCVLLNKQKLG